MAQALADAGAQVALTSRELERASVAASELGERAVGLELDVRDAGSVSAGVE
jgi:NADP-dependent 3-hydroxy acid dehydrogenase YdfG